MLQELFYWSWYVFLSSCNLKKLFFLSLVLDLLFGSGGACPKYFLPGGLRKNHLLGSISKMQSCTLFSHMFFFSKRGNLCYVGLEAVDAKSWERNSLHFFPQVIAINNQFPGPLLNVTTNQNVRVNVQNNLDEPLLITWYSSLLMPLWSLHFPAADLH